MNGWTERVIVSNKLEEIHEGRRKGEISDRSTSNQRASDGVQARQKRQLFSSDYMASP